MCTMPGSMLIRATHRRMSTHEPLGHNSSRWCAECEKCAFVFALLSAFNSPPEVWSIFGDDFDRPERDLPLFPNKLGKPLSKDQVVAAFRRCIEITGEPLERLDGRGVPRHRFHEHVPRVAGAQFLSRAGVQLIIIELFARWGSNAVLRYIQQAPLEAVE